MLQAIYIDLHWSLDPEHSSTINGSKAKRCYVLQVFDQIEKVYVISTARLLNAKVVNVQKPGPARSFGNSPDITLIASSPSRIFCNNMSLFFHSVYASSGLIKHNVQDFVENLAHSLGSNDELPPSKSVQGQNSTLESTRFISELLVDALLVRNCTANGLKRAYLICKSKDKKAMSKAAEDELSDAFYIDFESANEGSKTVSFHFLEQVLVDMAQNGALVKVSY